MNRKSKYVILTVALLTVLAAIMVSLGGRLKPGDAPETPEPEQSALPSAPESAAPPQAPEPPAAPDGPSAPMAPPDVPEAENTPEPENDIHAVAVTAGAGGTVEPRGLVSLRDGESVSFTFTPDEGYEVAEVKVDGRSVVSPAGYVFANVHESHTLYVVFRETEPEPAPEPEAGPQPTPEQTSGPEASEEPYEPVPVVPEDGDTVTQGFFG